MAAPPVKRHILRMIKYRIQCGAGHAEDIWFRSSESCDAQLAQGLVSCPVCGDTQLHKALMAPRIVEGGATVGQTGDRVATEVPPTPPSPTLGPAPHPAGERRAALEPPQEPGAGARSSAGAPPGMAALHRAVETQLRMLRAKVEADAEHVGKRFAQEARAIHEGEAEDRWIYGECSPEEAEALQEDGVAVSAIPWITRRDDA